MANALLVSNDSNPYVSSLRFFDTQNSSRCLRLRHRRDPVRKKKRRTTSEFSSVQRERLEPKGPLRINIYNSGSCGATW